jgi:hypothetical protein
MAQITQLAEKTEQEINLLYEKLPQEAKAQLEELKQPVDIKTDDSEITEEDKKKIVDDIDKFFKGKGDSGSA